MDDQVFKFNEYFLKYENNPSYQQQIIQILRSHDQNFSFEWVSDSSLQRRGIDLILKKGFTETYIDIKAISSRYETFYLQNIPIELVSNAGLFLRTKTLKGKSWLYKTDSKTDFIIYYWIDSDDNVKDSLLEVDYSLLREFAKEYFPLQTIETFLKSNCFNPKSGEKSCYLGSINGFNIYSAKNIGYSTINVPVDLDFLKKYMWTKFQKRIAKLTKLTIKNNIEKIKVEEFF